jgi:beta-glucosidase
MMKSFLIAIFGVIGMSAHAQSKDAIRFVDSLMRLMRLEEKVGQMNQYNGFWEVTGPVPKHGDAAKKYAHLRAGLVGAVLNVHGVQNVRALQQIAVRETRLGIPLLFGFDVIHGYKTVFPIPLAEAASWDLNAIEQAARVSAKEAAVAGINWTFAPMVDITRDARWGRVMEGAGEDPFLGAKIGVARVRGFQGTRLSDSFSIAACAKHFAAYGFAEAGRDYNTVDVGTATLFNTVFPPFKAASDAGVATFMNAFNIVNGVPATAHTWLQRDILKKAWGFKGFVVSDWGSGLEMIDHGYAQNLKDVAALAAQAGSDMDMESYAFVGHLSQLVKEGKVSMEVIDDAVRRILLIKYALGLFKDPFKYCSEEREQQWTGHPDHHREAFTMAQRSMVLLKNQSALLPLQKNQKVALIGALADDPNSPLGSWRIGAKDSTAVSVLTGMRARSNQVSFSAGPNLIVGKTDFIHEVNINETDTSGMQAAIDAAKAADVVVMVLGEHGFQSGEGRSRTQIGFPGLQQNLLEAVYRVNPNIVLVLMNGRPLAIPWAAEHIPAILEAWQPGTEGGHAIASVLFGEYNPSGKLPMSFPRHVGQLPLYYNHFRTGRPDPKSEVFWSHYIDQKNDAQFPFGFGLSYTKFTYSGLRLDSTGAGGMIVEVDVTNSGQLAGEEVVQLYLRDPVASVVRPVKELKGFSKMKLGAGETKRVRFVLGYSELGFFHPDGKYVVEPGLFHVMVGGNSVNGLNTSFHLHADSKWASWMETKKAKGF